MSVLIRNLNLIKSHRSHSWLSPSQTTALHEIQKALRVPGHINLWGGVGVGKTFLAWCLADELSLVYYPHLSIFIAAEQKDQPGVILDNCPHNRTAHREILSILRFQGISYAVIISRQLVRDYTYHCELLLTTEDILQIRSNLVSAGVSLTQNNVSNLWQLITPNLGFDDGG
jgi:hypothetical protein